MNNWIETSRMLPPIGKIVDTKIDREGDVSNEWQLKRGGENGRLWFFPEGGMYVYYTPTHWKSIPPPNK
jgi:hypothetical protein